MIKRSRCLFLLLLLVLTSNYCSGFEGLERSGGCHYRKDLSRPLDAKYVKSFEGYADAPLVETKLSANSPTYYTVTYTDAPSDDPTFTIFNRQRSNSEETLGEIRAAEIFIPGDGYIYASGHADSYFDHRRKFAVQNNKLEMIPQPYYYVGIDSTARKGLILYSQKNEASEEVCRIKTGEKADVLLSSPDVDSEWYLIRNEFGLVGWARIQNRNMWDSDIEGLYFAGD